MGAKTTLRWDEATLGAMHAAVRASYPEEACGFLLGTDGHVTGLRVARNVADDPCRGYVAAPEDLLAAFAETRGRGLELLGVFHSHPDGDGELSASDRAQAQPGWIYVVIATRGPKPSGMTVHAL